MLCLRNYRQFHTCCVSQDLSLLNPCASPPVFVQAPAGKGLASCYWFSYGRICCCLRGDESEEILDCQIPCIREDSVVLVGLMAQSEHTSGSVEPISFQWSLLNSKGALKVTQIKAVKLGNIPPGAIKWTHPMSRHLSMFSAVVVVW